MIKISDSIQEIIQGNSLLQFGFANRLFNLSQMAEYLKPLIEVRTKKEVKKTAILMSLSRFQRNYSRVAPNINEMKVENITIFSNLCSFTFFKNAETHKSINNLYNSIQKRNAYITISEGMNEITVILDKLCEDLLEKEIKEKPKYINKDLSGLGVKFSENYTDVRGFLHSILQQITMQGINIVEISSTFTEFIIYIEKKDVKRAFDTILTRFSV